MSGHIDRGRNLAGAHRRTVDVVIAGAGAGGSMAARELSRRGLSVLVLEEGKDHHPSDFTQREDEMIPELFQELGGRRTDDLSILVLSGRGLGGSTVHNTNLCKPTAPEILAHWQDDLGIDGVGTRHLVPYFFEVERDLGVRPILERQVNLNNAAVRRGTERLGYRGGLLRHNRDDRCIGSGFCELGCAYDAKLNARRILIPEATAAGAVFITEARVERVVHDGVRATGLEAVTLDAAGKPHGTLSVGARATCLAGSAVGSAALGLRSALPDPHQQLGTHLHIHPASLVAGRFSDRIDGWRGVPQSYECTEWLDLRPGSDRRVWLIPSFAHPIAAAAIMPGFGPMWMQQMRSFAHIAVLAAMVHDETQGRVYLDSDDRSRIAYEPNLADREQLALGAREAARVLLAAGAEEALVPALPAIRVRSERALRAITADRFLPHDGKLNAVHPMGTLRMGRRPEEGVTDERGRHFQLDGLYVSDGSLFPTSIGGPPQISIYAFAMKVARHLADDLGA